MGTGRPLLLHSCNPEGIVGGGCEWTMAGHGWPRHARSEAHRGLQTPVRVCPCVAVDASIVSLQSTFSATPIGERKLNRADSEIPGSRAEQAWTTYSASPVLINGSAEQSKSRPGKGDDAFRIAFAASTGHTTAPTSCRNLWVGMRDSWSRLRAARGCSEVAHGPGPYRRLGRTEAARKAVPPPQQAERHSEGSEG